MPIHRLYNTNNGAYLYTKSVADANYVLGKWPEFEFTDGIPAFCAYSIYKDGLTPIYRLYNTKNGAYLYTRGEADRDYVLNKYKDFEFTDGVASFYASLTMQDGLTPIYRLFNTKNGMFLYTRGATDRDYVMSKWPEFEFTDGIPAFYADTTNDSGPALFKYEGPEISVGLWYYGKTDIQNSNFKISANKTYNIRDAAGNILAQAGGSSTTSVGYDDNQNQLTVEGPLSKVIAGKTVTFDAADGDNSTLIFDTHRSSFVSDWRGKIDNYRGKIKIQYYRGYDIANGAAPGSADVTQIWVNNILPLEQYVWGSAETNGTKALNHTQVMTTAVRTYGFWYIKYANKYSALGFKIRSDSGSQNYGGYDWEKNHPNIKTAAQNTRGVIATYAGDVALTPYSSASDGRTRSWQEKWGSTDYPWCQSVPDPYGKDLSRSSGSHMVGLIGFGSENLASTYGWDWQRILHYYYTNISLPVNY
ncbi:MAG: SpoIID/LytB domain-containing protein [Candidatus Moranbacteria bacterium]|nr:SpoIID/LytB domain-containing protein [Candidatus Moranbacteria bacterium]